MKITTIAMAALALAPMSFAQRSEQTGVAEFTSPRGPRARVAAPASQDEPPRLGVMVSETEDGVLVSETTEGSMAAAAGLQPDDILFKIGGARVTAISDIPELLADVAPGASVSLTVIRPGEGLVTLEATRPAPVATRQQQTDPGQGGWVHQAGGAFLGVELGAADGAGVRVAGVIDGTAAWYAGLSEGDLLLSLDGHELNGPQAVAERVSQHAPGDIVSLTYSHDGERFQSRMRLGNRLPAGNPLGQFFAPGQNRPFGDSTGNMLFFQGDGPGLRGLDRRELGEGGVFLLDDDGEAKGHWLEADGARLEKRTGELRERLQKRLHEAGVPQHELDHGGQGPRALRIQIKDGVMTIDRDGEVEVIELEADDDARQTSLRTDVQGITGMLTNLVAGKETHGAQAECDALVAECDALVAECDALVAECEAAQAVTSVQTVATTRAASDAATAACAAVAAECTAVDAACEAKAAECAAMSAACQGEASECAAQSAHCDAAASECSAQSAACDDEADACEVSEACCDEATDESADDDAAT